LEARLAALQSTNEDDEEKRTATTLCWTMTPPFTLIFSDSG
jgi:hypothetical protein